MIYDFLKTGRTFDIGVRIRCPVSDKTIRDILLILSLCALDIENYCVELSET